METNPLGIAKIQCEVKKKKTYSGESRRVKLKHKKIKINAKPTADFHEFTQL